MAEERSAEDQWDGGWDAHRKEQLRARLRSTPEQRLAWLEQAIAWAYAVRPADTGRPPVE
jgi:hypothetical protein